MAGVASAGDLVTFLSAEEPEAAEPLPSTSTAAGEVLSLPDHKIQSTEVYCYSRVGKCIILKQKWM